MSQKIYGNCVDCRFSQKIQGNHWQRQYYPLHCLRFPPHPVNSQDIWNLRPAVSNNDGCFEFEMKIELQNQLDNEASS